MAFSSTQSSTQPTCKHCGSTVPFSESEFCCTGCDAAYQFINGNGYQQYYRFRDKNEAKPVNTSLPSFAYLNSPDYRAKYVQPHDLETVKTTWYLDGLQCPACTWLIEKVARDHSGVRSAELSFAEGRMVFYFEPDTDLEALAETLARLGYQAGLNPDENQGRDRDLLKLGISGAIAGNVMLMSMPFYTGITHEGYAIFFGWISFALTIPLLAYCARDFFTKAIAAFQHRAVSLDLPIAVGLTMAALLSTGNLLLGNVHGLYFDSMAMLVFFLLVGRFVQQKGVRRALAAGRRLIAKMPQLVDVLRNGEWTRLSADEIEVNDRLRLRAGDILPVDAVLESREASMNLHVVTGESRPVVKQKGDDLLAGSINLGAMAVVRAATTFENSKFAQFENMTKHLQGTKSWRHNSKLALYFTAAITLCASGGIVAWWSSSPLKAISVGMTIFIVACPCALALAGPTAHALALGFASKLGIWIKSANIFDILPSVSEVIFDKTGIITDGRPQIVSQRFFVENKHWLESAILELEKETDHPIVRAFEDAMKPRLTMRSVEKVKVLPGSGVRGTIEGQDLVISSPAGLRRFGVEDAACHFMTRQCETMGNTATPVCVILNGRPAALFGLEDKVRDEIPPLLENLKAANLDLTLLSGDTQKTVEAVCRSLALNRYRGNMLPEEKLAYVKSTSAKTTLMAGDGLNDMGALAASDIGVTHSEASDAALRFAGVIFQGRDMSRLRALIGLGKTADTAFRRGIALSLTYNVIAISLSLAGWIGPLTAAVLMPLSSLSMIGLSAWTFQRNRTKWEF